MSELNIQELQFSPWSALQKQVWFGAALEETDFYKINTLK